MWKWHRSGAIALAISVAGPLAAATISIDLADFDEYVMRDMDDANKDLGPALGAGNVDAANADIEVIRNGLDWTEDYFARKGGVDDGIKLARDGRSAVAAVVEAMTRKDLAKAAVAARVVTDNCAACHDLYKPLK